MKYSVLFQDYKVSWHLWDACQFLQNATKDATEDDIEESDVLNDNEVYSDVKVSTYLVRFSTMQDMTGLITVTIQSAIHLYGLFDTTPHNTGFQTVTPLNLLPE